MSLDDLARSAAADARRKAAAEVNAMVMLDELHRTRRNRSAASLIVGVLAVLVVVGGLALLLRDNDTASKTPPAGPSSKVGGAHCNDPLVTCLGGGRYQVGLPVLVTMALPANFHDDFDLGGDSGVSTYRSDIDAGVSLQENVTPVTSDGSSEAPGAGTTARSMATWLANRPFLMNGHVARTLVAGRTGWRVSADVKPGMLRRDEVAYAFTSDGGWARYDRDFTADYILLDTPGGGVTVIWSWAQGHGKNALRGNQNLIDGLSFG